MSEEQICLKFVDVTEDNELIFEETPCGDDEDYELQPDDFNRCDSGPVCKIIRNGREQILMLDNADLIFQDRTVMESKSETNKFKIQKYRSTDSSPTKHKGIPVTVQVTKDCITYTIACVEDGNNKKVSLKESIPTSIKSDSYDVIFHLKSVSHLVGTYQFESAKWDRWFLACEKQTNPELYKLTVKQIGTDEVDSNKEYSHLTIEDETGNTS
ncbi:uncharacterized protein LOC114644865 isoform X2 [Erpetoichthys calabaricus]|uniref:uncharacterized protein LOC114644865 isoform X2 n=1 Tax=Erpetoichthys calabaricus TaxID=27687 RepID=UPI00109F2CC9|nr:uncharacterized protein LOC114644865 isoform X2 [Erpetoichthys calabaricus]